MFSLSSRSEAETATALTASALPYGHYLASHVHEATRRICKREGIALHRVDLTHRERECLL